MSENRVDLEVSEKVYLLLLKEEKHFSNLLNVRNPTRTFDDGNRRWNDIAWPHWAIIKQKLATLDVEYCVKDYSEPEVREVKVPATRT